LLENGDSIYARGIYPRLRKISNLLFLALMRILLFGVAKDYLKDIIIVGMNTGFWLGEILNVTWDRLDRELVLSD